MTEPKAREVWRKLMAIVRDVRVEMELEEVSM